MTWSACLAVNIVAAAFMQERLSWELHHVTRPRMAWDPPAPAWLRRLAE